MHQIPNGGVHILRGTIARTVDGVLVGQKAHAVVDGHGHIAQGGVVTAPFQIGLVLFVAVIERSAVNQHHQGTHGVGMVLGLVNVHAQRDDIRVGQLRKPFRVDGRKGLVLIGVTAPIAVGAGIFHIDSLFHVVERVKELTAVAHRVDFASFQREFPGQFRAPAMADHPVLTKAPTHFDGVLKTRALQCATLPVTRDFEDHRLWLDIERIGLENID